MRALALFAHPVETSFSAVLRERIVGALRARGHEVNDCDLNAEGFDPAMRRQDRLDYHNVGVNRAPVGPSADRLLAVEALTLVFPVWDMGFPAILRGFVDTVFLSGVGFHLVEDGSYATRLHNIRRLAAVCTYGGPRCDYLAHYGTNYTTLERRVAFLREVDAAFARWLVAGPFARVNSSGPRRAAAPGPPVRGGTPRESTAPAAS